MIRRQMVASVAAVLLTVALVGPAVAVPGSPGQAPSLEGVPTLDAPTKAAEQATSNAPSLPLSPTDKTKVPHYFGPYSNWANSPQTLANAVVTISGGGGTGAEATATVNPRTGAISGITVTVPGNGYTTAPTVTITSPGMTPTTAAAATANISLGVVTAITVDQAGFDYTAPVVTISGGGLPSTPAAAQASGAVDVVNVTSGGVYAIQPIVEFSLPNDTLNGRRATGVATMDAGGVVTAVEVIDPGTGYYTAPTVTIWDGSLTQASANPAVATAVLKLDSVIITNGGAGYDLVPTVTITDSLGGIGQGASATAVLSTRGAVTSVTVTTPGAGYLTPGIKKFVDTLPGLRAAGAPTGGQNNLGTFIPVGQPDTTTYPGTDYYEIGLVQYRHQFHSSLPPTLMRGYVQLSTSVVPGAHVQLTNANLDSNVIATPIDGVFGVTEPSYLGPTIVAQKDRPVRITFRNLLPTGSEGNLFLPTDVSLMGSGMGPDMVDLDPVTKVPVAMPGDGTVMDGVRNPACGQGATKLPACFSENRATLHLHGGITPWISDGTPHQWTTPAGETTNYPKGVSVSNVPDMPDPGDGAITFFYTNQQSARLMFYHDHAWGITRLNVYAGEAAGYIIQDAAEAKLVSDGLLPADTLPLIIQDKTFVSDTILTTDPTWNSAKWGGTGNLWVPHVYMPAQNPGDPGGMSSFGRWMYGPWFWPPATATQYGPINNPYYNMDPATNFTTPLAVPCDLDNPATWQYQSDPFCEPAKIPGTPNVSVGMEAFNDTPIVNGTAYPKTTVDPKAYRIRLLNAANDRFWNLSWYVADPTTGTLSEVALNQAEVAAAKLDPNVFPTPNTTLSPKGPNWIHIGTEGGFLPAPTVVPAQPTTWITDPTRFDVGNVDLHSLLLAPAERADTIVDFSAYRGKTLILYNDAPAAFPARVGCYDYYTDNGDLTPACAPTTLPGYGPNTRTIMQVKVSNATPAAAYDRPGTTADKLGQLTTAFGHQADGSGVFESSQDPIIVGQAAYNAAYGTTFTSGGWCNNGTSSTPKCDGFLRINEQGGDNFKFDTLSGTQLSVPIEPKGMHDEMNSATFDEFGRMTANLGLEAPGITPLTQNIILYPYVNPATELLDATSPNLPSSLDVTPISSAADGTQIWKITHNGVDTHPIHFHLYNVQLLNRVTWDNIIIPPEPGELGWKETVRVSPLEDTIVAIRPIIPTLPFGVPNSERLLNPAMPEGARGAQNGPLGTEAGFNNTDAAGAPIAPIVNEMTNFDWEYVFHCHILSHEEMDMMRPVEVKVPSALPAAPVLTRTGTGPVNLTWTDGTPVNYLVPTTWTNPGTAEIGYRIERATITAGVIGAYAQIGTALANKVAFTDSTAVSGTGYAYRVIAYNAAGDSMSNPIFTVKFASATALARTTGPNPSSFGQSLTFTATVTGVAGTPTGNVQFTVDGVNSGAPVALDVAGKATFTTTTLAVGSHTIRATYAGSTVYNASLSNNLAQTVTTPASTTVVTRTTGPNPSVFGQPITFTATVSGPVGTPTGNVQFQVNGANVGGAVAIDGSGQATFTTTTLAVGSSTIRAIYAGSVTYSGSTSATVSQTVNRAATTTTLVRTAGANPSTLGASLTFTATVAAVAPGAGTPTGSVQFNIDGVEAPGGLRTLVGGVATYTTTTMTAGAHTVRASYLVSTNYNGSQSANVSQTVNLPASTTVVTRTTGPSPSVFGQSLTFTATVTGAVGTPTGNVQFQVNGVNVGGAVALNGSGVATFTTTALAVGTSTVRAIYAGSASYSGSTSANVSQTINRAATTTALARTAGTSPNLFGQSVTFTATVAAVAPGAGIPTGTVQFTVDGVNAGAPVALNASGVATFTTTTLTRATHTIRATYTTTTNFSGSLSNNVSQVVN